MSTSATLSSAFPASPTSSSSASANIPCACGSIRCASPAAPSPPTMSSTPSAGTKRRSLRRTSRRSQPAVPGQNFQISVRVVGRLSEPAQFDNIILKSNADGTLVRLKDVGHCRTRRRRLYHRPRLQRPRGGRHRRHPALNRQRSRRSSKVRRRTRSTFQALSARHEV